MGLGDEGCLQMFPFHRSREWHFLCGLYGSHHAQADSVRALLRFTPLENRCPANGFTSSTPLGDSLGDWLALVEAADGMHCWNGGVKRNLKSHLN